MRAQYRLNSHRVCKPARSRSTTTRSPQTLTRSQSDACRSIHTNARYSTVISSTEYGNTSHAPNTANPSARPKETTHNDANNRQRQRDPSESFRRDTTQNSDSKESGGIPAPDMPYVPAKTGRR